MLTFFKVVNFQEKKLFNHKEY